jgi:hypothetical protein
MPSGKTRQCKQCRQEKHLEKFPFTGENKAGKRYRLRTCNDCRTLNRSENREKWLARSYTAKTYKLLSDPSGTFSVCAHFHKGVVYQTLLDGLWTPGMWWLDEETGVRYEVQGNEEWHLLEACLGEKNPVKPERQRLVRSYGKRQPPRSG